MARLVVYCPMPVDDACPVHPRYKGVALCGGIEVHPCGCMARWVREYHTAALEGRADPRWLTPDDWYAAEVARMKERAPA